VGRLVSGAAKTSKRGKVTEAKDKGATNLNSGKKETMDALEQEHINVPHQTGIEDGDEKVVLKRSLYGEKMFFGGEVRKKKKETGGIKGNDENLTRRNGSTNNRKGGPLGEGEVF